MSTETTAQTTNSAETTAAAPTAVETKVPDAAAAAATTSKEATDKATQASLVTTTEAKVPDTKTPAAATTEVKPVVPEKYALTLPKDSKLGADVVAKIETLAKAKGWSNERAQEAVEERNAWEAERAQDQSTQIQHLNDKVWKEELASDPQYGGQKFEENGHLASKAAERFGGKEFSEQLKAMKLNHQPMLFKFLANVGRAMESDKAILDSKNPGDSSLPLEQRMYPDMYKTKES